MTIEKLAPTADSGFLRPRSLWARGGALALGAFWVGAVLVVGTFLGVASPVGGWFWALLCFLPGLVGAARLGGVRRWRDSLLLATAVSFVLGLGMYDAAPPSHGRIANVAQDVDLPADWELQSTDLSGNTWCWKGCPEVGYFYGVDESPGQAAATFDEILTEAGWVGGLQDPSLGGSWSRGRWRVRLWVPSTESRYGWREPVTARGLTPVEVTFSATR
jgi:hypothetical protein